MTASASESLEIRRFDDGDEPAVLALLAASLGWVPDELHGRFFAWKHRQNSFGPSPAWVATVAGEVVGFRTFLRWEFELDGKGLRAARAVDTATHPDYQGRGIFTRLTEHALSTLRDDGVAFVFNTPNERSRPGYLQMGWRMVRRLPVAARPASVRSVARLARARTPADKWSVATGAGVPAAEALANSAAVEALLGSVPRTELHTARSPAHLSWRYGFEPLCYRALTVAGDPGEGLVIFRLRRRGPALEAVVCEELIPADDPGVTRRLLRRVVSASGADYAVRLGDHLPRAGFVPLPRQGPILVCRDVCQSLIPAAATWHLGLGDVELL